LPSEPLILGFDTSAAHCAAALLHGDEILVSKLEEMKRGQAERLMVLLEEVLAEGGAAWGDLDAIGVGIGPGNFTGIRIAVSAARGLALGLGVPAVGVTGFEARAGAGLLPAVPAPRDQVYAALPGEAPRLMPRADAEAAARDAGLSLAREASPACIAEAIARAAAGRYRTEAEPPAPLYLRSADAAPMRDAPPALLDG
jgi:tRNA threonylcarbamoyl adenosine modification protein YeaZ